MESTISRRSIFSGSSLVLGTLLLDPRPGLHAAEAAAAADLPPVGPEYPSQAPDDVREIVAVSHGNFDRVRELVARRPELAKATWDWGFGDWESALGAASHVGRPDIANFLIEHGARPDIFTAAMLGNLDAVVAMIVASPGLQNHAGPHSITLLAHARAGGEPAQSVVDYLVELGGADQRPLNLELTEAEQADYLGTYRFGPGETDQFVVMLDRSGSLVIQRANGTPRVLSYQGDREFVPAGAPSARVRFRGEGGEQVLEILQPDLVVSAIRR